MAKHMEKEIKSQLCNLNASNINPLNQSNAWNIQNGNIESHMKSIFRINSCAVDEIPTI